MEPANKELTMNRKAFIGLEVLLVGGIIAVVAGLLGGMVAPSVKDQVFGATIATTSISDTINAFRTNVNTSLENINTQLGSVSSSISTLGDPVAIAHGGTGSSTAPSDSQFLSSNGTSTKWKNIVGSGAITVTTSTTSTVISTSGFDATANMAFSGNNSHSGSETFTSSTVVSSTGSLSVAGTATFTGTVLTPTFITATLAATTTVTPTPIYIDSSGNAAQVLANSSSSVPLIGFVQGTSSASSTVNVQITGKVSGFSGLTAGTEYFVNNSSALASTAGDVEVRAGTAMSSTTLLLRQPQGTQFLASSSISLTVNSGTITTVSATTTVSAKAKYFDITNISCTVTDNGTNHGTAEVFHRISRFSTTAQSALMPSGSGNVAFGRTMTTSISGNTITLQCDGESAGTGTHSYVIGATVYQYY